MNEKEDFIEVDERVKLNKKIDEILKKKDALLDKSLDNAIPQFISFVFLGIILDLLANSEFQSIEEFKTTIYSALAGLGYVALKNVHALANSFVTKVKIALLERKFEEKLNEKSSLEDSYVFQKNFKPLSSNANGMMFGEMRKIGNG